MNFFSSVSKSAVVSMFSPRVSSLETGIASLSEASSASSAASVSTPIALSSS